MIFYQVETNNHTLTEGRQNGNVRNMNNIIDKDTTWLVITSSSRLGANLFHTYPPYRRCYIRIFTGLA